MFVVVVMPTPAAEVKQYMAVSQAKFELSSIIRVLVVLTATLGALFAPVVKLYPHLGDRFMVWPSSSPDPDSLTIVANACTGIPFLWMISVIASFFVFSPLLRLCKVPEKNTFRIGFAAATAILLALISAEHLALPMRAIKEFGFPRWTFAIAGFGFYLYFASWISRVIFRKDLFSPDPGRLNVIFVSKGFIEVLAKVVRALFGAWAIFMFLGFLTAGLGIQGLFTQYVPMIGLYLTCAAIVCLALAVGVSIFETRFLDEAERNPDKNSRESAVCPIEREQNTLT